MEKYSLLVDLIVHILSGLAIAIPLTVKLVEYVTKLFREKNWSKLMRLTIDFMEEAEIKLRNGEDRKQWVLAMVRVAAENANCQFDEQVVGDLIDSMCDMASVVNATMTIDNVEKVGGAK